MRSMQPTNDSFMAELVADAKKTVSHGYYYVEPPRRLRRSSLVDSVKASPWTPVIAEIKFTSPVEGKLSEGDVADIARRYEKGGAVAISVLTEPKHFDGRLDHLRRAKERVSIPVLMKDIVVDTVQVDAAERAGADAVLLIASIFVSRLAEGTLDDMIAHAHRRHLEVLLEAHTEEEYAVAMESDADLVGINNRNLKTLEVSLDVSKRLLANCKRTKPVVCESGISTREQIAMLKSLGADAFLVGSALMKSKDPVKTLTELVGA